jgi:hypothetical protein
MLCNVYDDMASFSYYNTRGVTVKYRHGPINEFAMMLEINTTIHGKSMHHHLKADLTKNIWQRFGSNQHQVY